MKPAILLDVVLLGVLLACGFYIWISHHELQTLTGQLAAQTVQLQQNADTIKQLNSRLLLVQKLNESFNKAVNDIRDQQAVTNRALTRFNLHVQSSQHPRDTEQYISKRTNDVFDSLNSMSRPGTNK